MILMKGNGVSGGMASGPLYPVRREDETIRRQSAAEPEAETDRFFRARKAAEDELTLLAEDAGQRAGKQAALLFETHALLAGDEELTALALSYMEDMHCPAEEAVMLSAEQFAGQFEKSGDPYLKARAADVRDVAARIIRCLAGEDEGTGLQIEDLTEPVILAADDLSPSEMMRLDRRRILAIALAEGSEVSHTVILARIMEIPTVIGLTQSLLTVAGGTEVILDGTEGTVILNPDKSAMEEFQNRKRLKSRRAEDLEAARGLADVTKDGCRVDITCSIGGPEDLPAVSAGDGHAIGLYRSEFQVLALGRFPDEEEQTREYRSVISAMNGGRVVIRTFDIGEDKQIEKTGKADRKDGTLETASEAAGAGRGIGFLLSHPELFLTQLRAVCRASAFGKAAVMFPMIRTADELRACRTLCRRAQEELEGEGIPYDPQLEIGIMIETKEAVRNAQELAAESDFFSVGTNDLSQALLETAERPTVGPEERPVILHALRMVSDAAHSHGIRIGICGELGADSELLEDFLAIGIDELTVPPSRVLPLRAKLRTCRKRIGQTQKQPG